MKMIITLLLALALGISTVSAATGSTLTCLTGLPCGGGPTQAFNVTTKKLEMVPQCFPWVWLNDFYKGNIFMIYENQNKCRAQRLVDFGM